MATPTLNAVLLRELGQLTEGLGYIQEAAQTLHLIDDRRANPASLLALYKQLPDEMPELEALVTFGRELSDMADSTLELWESIVRQAKGDLSRVLIKGGAAAYPLGGPAGRAGERYPGNAGGDPTS